MNEETTGVAGEVSVTAIAATLEKPPKPQVEPAFAGVQDPDARRKEMTLRITAAGVFLLVVAAGFLVKDLGGVLLIASPVLVGALFPLLRPDPATQWIASSEAALASRLATEKSKTGKFSRFFTRPLLAGTLWIWRVSEGVSDAHLRAGLRAAAGLAFGGMMLVLVLVVGYVLLMVAVAVAALLFALWLIGKMGSGTHGSDDDRASREPEVAPIGPRGTRLVKEGLFGDTPTGIRVDDAGRIMNEGVLVDQPTGMKIDSDGRYVKEGIFFDTPTGTKINGDGRVVEEGIVFDSPTGTKVDEKGRVVKEGVFGDTPTGLKYKK